MRVVEQKVNLGFDIGIASCGWSVVATEGGRILETGVSIFPAASASKNVERRQFRQARRLLRRRKNRVKDAKKVLEEYGFPYTAELINYDPYRARVKGVSEKLSREELAAAIHHLVKRRGISYSLVDAEDEEGSSYKASLTHNQKALQNETPAEIQLKRLTEFQKVRGQVEVEGSGETGGKVLLNVFPTKDYLEEAKKILEKQQEFYPEITDEMIQKIIAIIQRKRDYFKGPGNEKSRTDYGIYRTNGETLTNLFEILIGKDKIFPDEYRAAGNSYTAQVYNLLNDLNNLRIGQTESGRLSSEQKKQILTELKTTTKAVTMMKLISKVAGVKEDQIHGYQINSDEKPEIHSMPIYRKIHKNFLSLGYDITEWPTELLDKLGDILTLNTENGEIRRILTDELQAKYPLLNNDLIDKIIENKTWFALTSNQKWHRFSYKTMKLLIPELLHTSKEQMTILTEMNLIKKGRNDYNGKNKIDIKRLSENIYNPVVRKSVKQTMKIFNELIKKYPNIAYIVIEMPRDGNEEEVRRDIQKFQKKNKKEKDDARQEFQDISGLSDIQLIAKFRKSKKFATKLRLWYQQMGKCPYSGKTISPEDMYSNEELFDIDHIIPRSVSFDDGLNNKVLCYAEANRKKGNNTPYEYFKTGQGQGFAAMKAMFKSNKRVPGAKIRNLFFTEDLNNIEVRKRFIARNLVDTRYASRVVLNELQQFVDSKNMDAKVTVIRGKFTSKLREKWNVSKSRDTHHHHAIDAAVIAVSPMLKLWEKGASIIPNKVGENVIDIKTGEILNEEDYGHAMYDLPYAHFLDQLPELWKRVKFNHQVDKKMNRKVSDATIYTTRKAQIGKDKEPEDYVLGTIKDIYKQEDYLDFKKIYEKDKTKFLMQRIDPKTFEKLERILQEYPESVEQVQDNGKVKEVKVSPFAMYREENGFIKKYSKKNNGPIVKSLKYYHKKLGSHIDITPQAASNKKVALQSLKPWRTDVYFNHLTKEYEIMGLKYSDLKYGKNGEYGVAADRYDLVKKKEHVDRDSEFLFSLYRNDRIKIIDDNKAELELLFGSRTVPDNLGYVELKPITKAKFDNKETVDFYGTMTPTGRFVKKFTRKGYKLYKVNTDELGNPFYIEKENGQSRNILDM
ncbi:MAG: type II CRISPR RNA-guided endonuclease Cas9 [Enterococcaceae bacterium]|jgi:CRISPR-associated endonuclease Csn1|nr:type II CRISPR RNA-guided endonuclease Cas9 [Enterococcaceae bacterium]